MTEFVSRRAALLSLAVILGVAYAIPARAQNGTQQIFEKNCASCHGKDGAGRTAAATRMKIPDLRSKEVQQLSDKQIFDTIAYGTGHKQYPHAFADKGMTGVLISDLVAYLRDLAKPPKKPAKATP